MRLNRKGFTLSELMLGAMILIFCLTSILSMFINSSILSHSNRDVVSASMHCQHILEEIRAVPFSQLTGRLGDGDWDLTTAELSASPYNFSVLNSEAVDTGIFQAGNPLGVYVNVTWKVRGKIHRSYELRTLFTD